MTKEFRERLTEEMLFNNIKDEELVSAENFRSLYRNREINYTRLYRRITNYQIKKYGKSLSTRCEWMTCEERNKLSLLNNQRNYYRRNR